MNFTKMVKVDFGTSIPVWQAQYLDDYTGRGNWETWKEAREVLYRVWDTAPEWVSNLEPWLAACHEAGLVDEDGNIIFYRGWKDALPFEEGEHTSWTTDLRVAVWHATGHQGGKLAAFKAPATVEALKHLFIWASEHSESEVLFCDEMLWSDGPLASTDSYELHDVDAGLIKDPISKFIKLQGGKTHPDTF